MNDSDHSLGDRLIKYTISLLVLTSSLMVPIMVASATEQGDNSNNNGGSEGCCYNV
jgi:hypothetical protein